VAPHFLLTRGFSVVLVVCVLHSGCGGKPRGAEAPGPAAHTAVCGIDDTREYFCEELLPPTTSMPAPSPFESCPSVIDSPDSMFTPAPSVGLFDTSYTVYMRKRAPPGHSCCYSWCSHVKLGDPSAPSIQTTCASGAAFREEYCMEEPEVGTALSVGVPFDHCPAAIVPPRKAVFSVPESAPFDAQITSTHRGKGQAHCCYAWCSLAPPGSGLQKRH
jgi:hypothetical protein